MKLKDKKILITGASSGIGKAFALKCAQDGCHIYLASRNEEKLNEVKKLVEEKGSKATVIVTDVTKAEQVKDLFLQATEDGEILDVVFDNAGLGHIANIYEQTVEEIEQMVDVNVKGMIYVAKYASEVLVRQKSGHLIMTSSLAGLITVPEWATYVATKWAITGFADSIRFELKPFGIRVSTLHPGLVKNEFFDERKANLSEKELREGDAITSEEVADVLYDAVFTDIHRVLVPNMVKSYSFMYRHMPKVVEKLIEKKTEGIESKPKEEDEPEFSYVDEV